MSVIENGRSSGANLNTFVQRDNELYNSIKKASSPDDYLELMQQAAEWNMLPGFWILINQQKSFFAPTSRFPQESRLQHIADFEAKVKEPSAIVAEKATEEYAELDPV